MFDIAIIGAGPAGAMLARLVGARYRVLLLDHRALDAPPVEGRPGKCCGGLISGNAQQALAELGVSVPPSVMTRAQPADVLVCDLDNGIRHSFPRPYINCHRELFDRWLVSLAPAGVEVRCGCRVRDVDVDDDGVSLTFSAGGRHHTERARLLVGADGASSLVRRRLFPRVAAPATYLAIQEWYAPDETLPHHLAIFDRQVTDFYGWAVPKDGLLAIGAALTPHCDPAGHFHRLLAGLSTCGITLGACLRREGALLHRPRHPRELCLGADHVALIGEAAGWINPSSAEGFSYAFNSAGALAEALAAGLDGATARYAAHTQPLRRALTREMLKSAAMFTPWLRRMGYPSERATRDEPMPVPPWRDHAVTGG